MCPTFLAAAISGTIFITLLIVGNVCRKSQWLFILVLYRLEKIIHCAQIITKPRNQMLRLDKNSLILTEQSDYKLLKDNYICNQVPQLYGRTCTIVFFPRTCKAVCSAQVRCVEAVVHPWIWLSESVLSATGTQSRKKKQIVCIGKFEAIC